MSEILAAKTGDSLADTNGKKVYKRKKVIKPFKVFKRRKVRLVSVTGVTVKNTNASCYNEPAVSRFGPVESPSTKATDAIGDDESIEMDVETNQPTCRNSLDVRSEVIKVMENKEATYVKLNEDKKAHVVSSIISYHNAEFFDYMNKDLKNIVVNIDKYDGFRERFIKCYTKFVLSVLDEEYLERTYSMKELEKQSTLLLKDFMEFSENLQQSDTCEELEKQYASLTEQVAELRRNEVDNRGEFAKQFKYLLSHSNEITERLKINPIISAIVDGRINLSKYPLLREHDIGYILQMYEMKFPREDISHELRVCPRIGKDDIRMVRDAVVDFQDLADRMKNHLVMELMEAQCSGLLDMLLAETVTKMDIFELLSTLPSDSQTRYFCDDLFYEDDSVPKHIANYVLNGFYFLVLEIFRGLLDCSNYVKRPLVCGWVGKFSEEVVEVVSTADLQRRLDAQSFISVRHILLAVIDRTTVDAVKQLVIIALVICFSQCAEVPPYGIYLSAWKLANKHGSAKVRIEHLAVAAVREGASLGISMCYAVSSDENAVKFLNEYCEIQPESDYDDMDSFDELSICEPVEEYASRCLDVNFFNGSGDMRVSVDLGKGSQASEVLVEQ